MLERLRSWMRGGRRTYAGAPRWLTGAGSSSRGAAMGVGASVAEPYGAHEALYRCVSLISRTLAGIPVRLTQGEVDVTDRAWRRLLERPNPHQRMSEFVEAVLSWWEYDGEVFVVLTDNANVPTKRGKVPERLWVVPGGMVREDVDVAAGVLLGWSLALPGTSTVVPVPVESVIPLRFWNPRNPLRGMSPLSAALRGVRLDLKASAYSEALYDNGADPGGVLTTEGTLSKRQREDMRKEWEERHQGVDKAGRTAVLEGGLTYQQLTVNNRDLQHLEQRQFSRKQVATVYGVPLFFLNEQGDAAYAAARAAMRVLWENTLLPLASAFCDAMRWGCLAYIDDRLRWQFDTRQVEALREDLGQRVDQVDKMVRAGIPRNEAVRRVDLGVPPVDGGDVPLVQAGLAPLAMVAEGATMLGGPAPDVAGDPGAPPSNPDATPQADKAPAAAKGPGQPVPEPGKGAQPPLPEGKATAAATAAAGLEPAATAYNGAQVAALVDTVKAVVAKEIPAASAKAILAVAFPVTPEQAAAIVDPAAQAAAAAPPPPEEPPPPPPGGGAPPPPPDKPKAPPEPPRAQAPADARAQRWHALVRTLLTPWESRVRARLRGWLQGRRAEALAALETMDRALDQAAWARWLEEAGARWRKGLGDQMRPLYRQMADAAAKGVLPEVGPLAAGKDPLTVATSPALLDYVDRKVALVQGVSDTVLDGVRKAVATTLASNGTVREAQDAVRQAMNTSMSRSLMVARTETAQVVNGSRLVAMAEVGVKETEWLSSRDNVVRPNPETHDDPAVDHGALDGKRVALGESFVEGVTLAHPGDPRAQPARWVVNCRCLGLPVSEPLPPSPEGGKV